MRIEWNTKPGRSPYLMMQRAHWTGVTIHRAQVVAGRMLEHAPDCHEINVSLSGIRTTEKISSSGKIVRSSSGTGNVCLTPYGQPVSASWNQPIDNLGIYLDPEFVKRTAFENRFAANFELVEVYEKKDPLIQHIGLTLLAEAESETPAGRLYADSLIQTLTLHLLKNYSTAGKSREKSSGGLSGYKLRRVREYIDANLGEDISLAEIASVAGLSQYHFARAFRKSTGQTPQQFLMQRRIERAKQLLAKDDLPLVEVSLRAGFKNQSHFTTLFRKFTKMTPKLWREMKLA
jgi:AraC-type DNA-binding domain-containing proteins